MTRARLLSLARHAVLPAIHGLSAERASLHATLIAARSFDPSSRSHWRIDVESADEAARALFVKVADAHAANPRHEMRVMSSAITRAMADGLIAPLFLGAAGSTGDEIVMWSTFHSGRPGCMASASDFALAAGELGKWQAREARRSGVVPCSGEQDIVTFCREQRFAWLEDTRLVPSVVRQVWDARERLLLVATAPPLTFCHNDFWHGNLILPRDGSADPVVLVDWALAGRGGLAADLPFAVAAAVWDDLRAADDVAWFEQEMLSAYIDGLTRGGAPAEWLATARTVFSAVAALRYALLLTTLKGDASKDLWLAKVAARTDRSVGEVLRRRERLAPLASAHLQRAIGDLP